MKDAPWLVPLLIALAAAAVGIAQLGGARGANRPYPSRGWAAVGVTLAAGAAILIVLAAVR